MYTLKKEELKLPAWLLVYDLQKSDDNLMDLTVLKKDEAAPIREWQKIHLTVANEDKEEFMAVNNLDNCCLANLEFVPPSQK